MKPQVLLTAKELPQVAPEERTVLTKLEKLALSMAASSFAERTARISEEIEQTLISAIPDDVYKQIHVFPWEKHDGTHLRMSLLVQHLRSADTGSANFRYLTAEVYRLLLHNILLEAYEGKIVHSSVVTRVNEPHPQKSIQQVPKVDLDNTAIAVFMRAGLYPSLVVGKEIELLTGKVPEYTLFRIRRNGHGAREDLEYVLDYEHNAQVLDGKEVFVPEPMLATAGSLLAVRSCLARKEIKPGKLSFLGLIGAFEGAVLAARHAPELELHLAWMDPLLNDSGYILPGLGDAGDLLNGDTEDIDDLLKSYGKEFCRVHERQIEAVYKAMKQEAPGSLF